MITYFQIFYFLTTMFMIIVITVTIDMLMVGLSSVTHL